MKFVEEKNAFLFLEILSYLCFMVVSAEHLVIRELKTWRSYGIDGQGPTVDTLIKDLGDEHLLNIIRHLERNFDLEGILSPSMQTMHDEIAWRLHGLWQRI